MPNVLQLLEGWKFPSWMPVRWLDIATDMAFYDTTAVSLAEWWNAYRGLQPMREGRIVVVRPGAASGNDELRPHDIRSALDGPLAEVSTIVVPGCGSSRVGAIAFGRTVADALGSPVATVIAGHGMGDLIFEGGAGVTADLVNWTVGLVDPRLPHLLRRIPEWVLARIDLTTLDWTGAVPEAATVHHLLLHGGGRFTTVVGHSKGNLSIAWALHALEASLRDVTDDDVLEHEFGLSRVERLQELRAQGAPAVAAPTGLDVFTFGCWVSLPGAMGHGTHQHAYPSHQYVGNADLLARMNTVPGRFAQMIFNGELTDEIEIADQRIVYGNEVGRFPFIGHNLIVRNPCHPWFAFHMPAHRILARYTTVKGLRPDGRAIAEPTDLLESARAGDPAVIVRSVAGAVTQRTRPPYYASPSSNELRSGTGGLSALVRRDAVGAERQLAPLGFTVSTGVDPVTSDATFPAGRPYLLAVSEVGTAREWGLYLLDTSTHLRLCIAVPHTGFDANCHELALRLWRSVPGSLLMMSTVHRNSTWAGQPSGAVADQAYNTESLFHHAWTDVCGPPGVPQVQIHGFADRPSGVQAVVSTGSARLTLPAMRIAEQLGLAGLTTVRNWDGSATELKAMENVQGKAAGINGWAWTHVELNASVRMDPGPPPKAWERAIDAVRAADPALYRPRSAPDPPVLNTMRNDHFHVMLRGNRTLHAPTRVGSHRALVQVQATGGTRRLTFGPSIQRSAGIASSVLISPGTYWYGDLVYNGPTTWRLEHAFTL